MIDLNFRRTNDEYAIRYLTCEGDLISTPIDTIADIPVIARVSFDSFYVGTLDEQLNFYKAMAIRKVKETNPRLIRGA